VNSPEAYTEPGVSPPAWQLPHLGLYWYDMKGPGEELQKIHHALFRRGLYNPHETAPERSHRLFLGPARGRPTSHVTEARRAAKADAAALEIEAASLH